MSPVITIAQVDDRRLDDYRGLRDPARRSRLEPEGGFFVAEGVTVIERLLESDLGVRSLLLSESKFKRLESRLAPIDAPVFVAEADVMEQIVGFDIHRGALASADRPKPPALGQAVAEQRLVCALEGINDHENLGAIMRSAAAFGAGTMLLDPTCADPWYRRSVRVSMGTVFDLSVVRAPEWPDEVAAVKDCGLRVVALTLGPNATPLDELEIGPPTMVMLGAEGVGLSSSAIDAADVEATIPISPRVDSLNVGHAAAVAFARLSAVSRRSNR